MKTVIFDLDGTLLPMDQEEFTRAYFKALSTRMARFGYDPQKLVKAVWDGTRAMIANDGARSNFDAFWDGFAAVFGDKAYDDIPLFDEFYETDFHTLKSVCGFTLDAARLIKKLKAAGCRLVLASNPIFPKVAHINRMRWAGLDENDFCYITSYENSNYCKPKAGYYSDILRDIGEVAENCIMVGNDVSDDMPARDIGIGVFLLTDCLINTKNVDISADPHGGYAELNKFLDEHI